MGANLFHSFSDFNIYTNESATFTEPASIENIISRITGNNASFIDGRLTSAIQNANLFLLNPSGVMFGPNAVLDVSGSFAVSTADYLRLGNNGRFDATNPNNSALTSSPPSAFGFLGNNPAPISVDRSFLEAPEGKTLSLIGGDIQVTNGYLVAPGGRIDIASVGSAGEVVPTSNDLDVSSFSNLGEIDITHNLSSYSSANINTSGKGAGDIYIRGGRFVVDGGRVFSNTRGAKSGGEVDIKTDELIITNHGRITSDNSGSGNAGDLIITANSLIMSDGGLLRASTYGSGQGGNIEITAGSILVAGEKDSDRWESGILVNTYSRGDSGDISIFAGDLMVDNGWISVSSIGNGNGGNLRINTRRLELRSGVLYSAAEWSGNGGNIEIAADSILMTGSYADSTLIAGSAINAMSAAEEPGWQPIGGMGDAGDIRITTGDLTLKNWSNIYSSTGNTTARAGNISISASGTINISGKSQAWYGTVMGYLPCKCYAGIYSSSFDYADAGSISIFASKLILYNYGTIDTKSYFGGGGNIEINVESIKLVQGGLITASVSGHYEWIGGEAWMMIGGGGGGNININAASLFAIVGNSNITANAASGPGGNIKIRSEIYLQSSDSEITASSSFGIQGVVEVESPEVDISSGLGALSTSFSKTGELLIDPCEARTKEEISSFIITGRGGIPAEPDRVAPGGKIEMPDCD